MTDEEALNLLRSNRKISKDELGVALFTAVDKLAELCWRSYNPETFAEEYKLSQGMLVHLGIRYSDGSFGRVEGMVVPDIKNVWKLEIQHKSRSIYTKDAVIEKWMPYPDYNGER